MFKDAERFVHFLLGDGQRRCEADDRFAASEQQQTIFKGFAFDHIAHFFVRFFSAKYHWPNEIYESEDFDTSGVQLQAAGQLTKQLRVQGTFSHQKAIYYSADPFAGRATSATAAVIYQPTEQWLFDLRGTYSGFSQASDGRRLYDYGIYRAKTTYQWNRYLFFRGIGEYNTYRGQLLTDFLASFTYIPGTVFHVGYGSFYETLEWQTYRYVPGRDLLETRRGFLLKLSYLWRL